MMARELDVVVVSPAYRLAPEHPFPAALDDCMATLTRMRDCAGELGIDPGMYHGADGLARNVRRR